MFVAYIQHKLGASCS